jgi:Glutathione S-transferase, N-terminal domain
LDIEIVETKPPVQDIEYFKLNPLGRVPTFVGANGYILTETMAIAIYCMSKLSLIRPVHHSKMSHIINFSYPCLKILLTIYDSDHVLTFRLYHLTSEPATPLTLRSHFPE